jgi:DNA-binding winged helix-turn-helix (wHTH) protein/tetratricopeptide (TPR) repeat protein
MWQFPPFRLDVVNQCLYRGDERVPLMPKPFAVLQYLVEHAGRLVSQDELLEAIWPETHVQPEVLRRYILEIRRALGDQPETPRFIETITKRGYRFIAEVTASKPETPVIPQVVPERKPRKRVTLIMAAGLALALLVVGGFLRQWQLPKLTEKDTIVISDFTNTTGDSVFDETLRKGLAVQLEQSPFLRVASEEQIQQTLRLMERPPDLKRTAEVAREACQRTGGTILIDGSISQIGARYNLILRAVNCSNAESLASAEAQANDKNHVLEALGRASFDIRKRLGESRATIQRFDTPLVQASTSSLEALQVYSLGYKEAVAKGNSVAAIPLLQRAIKLDPNFAMAYSTLGLSYWNVGETTLASENIRKAYDLRAGLTEGEKLRIESEYPSLVTDNLDKARRAYEVWAQTYPRDWTPRNHLGVIHTVLGQHEQALAQYRAALRLYPESSLIRGNLIACLLALHRLDEASPVIAEANAKDPDSPGLRVELYRLAFLQNDWKGMERQVNFGAGKPGLDSELQRYEAATAAYFGQLKRARTLFRQAIASADRAEGKEAEAGFMADEALTEALFGNEAAARSRAESALRLSTGLDVQYRAALALASAGEVARGRALAEDLDKRTPEDTIVQFIYLPALRAQILLHHDEPPKIIELLQTALPFELGGVLYPAYLRGLAYLSAHRGAEAQSEFEKILNHRGVVLNFPIGALAHLQLGRAFAMRGDFGKARAAYNDFLTLWKDADADIPILAQARIELAKLKGP